MRKFFGFCWQAIGSALQIRDVILLTLGISGGGVAVVTFLQQLPFYFPLIIGIIALAIILYAIYRIRIGYLLWIHILDMKAPIIERIMTLLWDMHQALADSYDINTSKALSKKQVKKISRGVLKALNTKESQVKKRRNLKDVNKLLTKRLYKVYKIDSDDYTLISEFLSVIGQLLDKEGFGIGESRYTEGYSAMYTNLMHYQLELPAMIKPPTLDLLDRAYNLSYGLHSFALFTRLSQNRYRNRIPEEIVASKEEFIQKLNLTYLKALSYAKGTIIKSYVKEPMI